MSQGRALSVNTVRRAFGAIPMYRLTVICLTVISAVALLLSLLGKLSFEPLALLASCVVVLIATVTTGWLGAKIVKTTAHRESSIITALLIFLVVPPSLEWPDLAGLAAVGAIAGTSKYLITVRGRHIVNPAAFSLLIAGITGLSTLAYPAWWVGTGVLLPVVAVSALLIFLRTRRSVLGVSFLTLAVLLSAGRILLVGSTLTEALSFALFSSPLVFFAGFMLTEPLTLPPKRWQQLLIAVVAAVLTTVPFSLGALSNTPQLALVVVNVLAFFFGQRRSIRLEFVQKSRIGSVNWQLTFRPHRPVRFSPGQFLELTLPHHADFRGTRRHFSVSSPPGASLLTIAITEPDQPSSFKRALLALEPGARVLATGVGGDFLLPKDAAVPLVLMAGGIGITPFASQLAWLRDSGQRRDIVVAYAVPSGGPVPYASLLTELAVPVVLFSADPPEGADSLPEGWSYPGPGRMSAERLAELIPDLTERRAYLSGPPTFVAQLRRELHAQGVRRIATDSFAGY